jgi:peptidoglycan-N-acetylglucosamine deacetylase
MRLCAISVDLDEIPNYHAIHGLEAPAGPGKGAVYEIALERLEALSRAHGVPLTLFAIGADMARADAAARLRSMAERGHEIANHSLDHLYDLTRQSRDEMRRQVQAAAVVLERATGQRPVGFRAPGYTITDELVEVLVESGVAYDSSVFPCPPYYAAKAAALVAIRARGRRSSSLLDTPAVLAAPVRPYRLGKPYWRRGHGLLELPIQVTRGPRLPFIGTSLLLSGPSGARWLTRGVAGEPLVNLELHGIDVLDENDGLRALRGYQRELGIPTTRKLETLHAVIELLKKSGYAFVRLREAAEAVT